MNNELSKAAYKVDVDWKAIDDMPFEELVNYIYSNHYLPDRPFKLGAEGLEGLKRFTLVAKIVRLLCENLGFKPSNEQYLFVLTNYPRILCEACAGSGKTTFSQFILILEKLANQISGHQMLALAYNNHASKDMGNRHTMLVRKINSLKVPGIKLDSEIVSLTIHAWCKIWINEYADLFGLQSGTYTMEDGEEMQLMRAACTMYLRKVKVAHEFYDNEVSALCQLYSFLNEMLLWTDTESWNLCNAMTEITVDLSGIVQIFKAYTALKTARQKLDYSEWPIKMYSILKDPDRLARIRRNYSVILVDEYQDITPSMRRIIMLMTEGDASLGIMPNSDCRLVLIGDNDQSIYSFRGTDPFNCLRFRDDYGFYEKSMITLMSINRRCRAEILDRARKVIESNQERIDKPIRGIKPGGTVQITEYNNSEQQFRMLCHELSQLSPSELSNSCICYRNKASARFIGMYLLEKKIPFTIVNGAKPFSDRLSQSIEAVLQMLTRPADKYYMKSALYRVLPKGPGYSKAKLEDLITKSPEETKFWELNYGSMAESQGFTDAIRTLVECYKHHKLRSITVNDHVIRTSDNMNVYVPRLIELIEKYYFNFLNYDQADKSNVLDDEYINYVKKYYSRQISYDDFRDDKQAMLRRSEEGGIYLTTFHGLKGLEFDKVFVIDMAEAIFPGTDLKSSKKLTLEQSNIIESECRRLLYVVCTRAKDYLHLYFSKNSPSRYLRFFKETPSIFQTTNKASARLLGLDMQVDEDEFVDSLGANYTSIKDVSENAGLENKEFQDESDVPPWKTEEISVDMEQSGINAESDAKLDINIDELDLDLDLDELDLNSDDLDELDLNYEADLVSSDEQMESQQDSMLNIFGLDESFGKPAQETSNVYGLTEEGVPYEAVKETSQEVLTSEIPKENLESLKNKPVVRDVLTRIAFRKGCM